MHVLQWLRAHGSPWDKEVCSYAAFHGHLEVLKWATLHGCAWDQEVWMAVMRGGHKDVMVWAEAYGCMKLRGFGAWGMRPVIP